MIAASLTALFIFSGAFAIATIIGSWRRHGAAAMAIHGRLRQAQPSYEVRIAVRLVEVRPVATILRPEFGSVAARASLQARTGAMPVAA